MNFRLRFAPEIEGDVLDGDRGGIVKRNLASGHLSESEFFDNSVFTEHLRPADGGYPFQILGVHGVLA